MPSRRNQKRRPLAKDKKNITSRLMMISLRADDYIYKNKPISIKEAKAYAQEIASFKKLYLDERCLQVIEKLTSHMNNIIKEQSNDITEVNINKSKEIESNKDKPTCDKYNVNYTQNYAIVDNEIEQSSLINTEETNNNNKDHITPNSNFIVNQDLDMKKENTANNFKGDIEKYKNVVKFVCDVQNFENQIVNTTNDLSILLEEMPSNFEYIGKDMNLDINQTQQIKENSPNIQCTRNTKKVIKQRIKKSLQSDGCKILQKVNKQRVQKNTVITNKKAVLKKAATKIYIKKSKTDSNSTIKPQNIGKGADDTIMADVGHSEDRVKTSKIKKNNRNTKKIRQVMDLSWVEDLKFIREIDIEEHIVDNLEESFWKDLSLPPNLNIKDFDYDNINIWKN